MLASGRCVRGELALLFSGSIPTPAELRLTAKRWLRFEKGWFIQFKRVKSRNGRHYTNPALYVTPWHREKKRTHKVQVAAGLYRILELLRLINFTHPNPRKQMRIDQILALAAERGCVVPQKHAVSDYQKGYFDGFLDASKGKSSKYAKYL